jgi:6-phosphogluconolactonase
MKVLNYDNTAILEEDLAIKIANLLAQDIKNNGFAQLLVSGGSTPINLFKKLSNIDIDWKNVTIGLVDERFVPQSSEFSNESLVKTHLIQNFASKADLIGMVYDSGNEENNLKLAIEKNATFLTKKISISILGMGEDGHTASLFPGDPSSEKDLESIDFKGMLSTIAPNHPTSRITFSKNLILSSELIFLMLVGNFKMKVLEKAKEKNYPIAKFMDKNHVQIYFTSTKS